MLRATGTTNETSGQFSFKRMLTICKIMGGFDILPFCFKRMPTVNANQKTRMKETQEQ